MLRAQVNFHPTEAFIPSHLVFEGGHRDVPAEFSVDPAQQVEVELGGDPLSVVKSREKYCLVLQQVDSKEQDGVGAERITECP